MERPTKKTSDKTSEKELILWVERKASWALTEDQASEL